jgi:hypothetical protein
MNDVDVDLNLLVALDVLLAEGSVTNTTLTQTLHI